MAWILNERWFWLIVLAMIAVFVLPFIIILFILALPSELKLVMTIVLIVCWGAAAGYRDWVTHKRKEEKEAQK